MNGPGTWANAAAAWIGSGAAALTGWSGGPGLVPPTGILERIRRLGDTVGVDAFAALTERAAAAGLSRQGQISCGGSSRLLRAADGWVAVTLARPDDVANVAAWLELAHDPAPDPWPAVTEVLENRPAGELVDRAILLGLPVAAVPEAPPHHVVVPAGPPDLPGRWVRLGVATGAPWPEPLVVDLSSLWAGPLCARSLAAATGAEVVKVESVARPDGARLGPGDFFDRLHGSQRMVTLDFATEAGRHALRDLIATADVVIEASRPRALAQLGVGPDTFGDDGPPVWVSITGHGRTGSAAHRVGFGDDAAAAAGLVAPTEAGPVFVADAIADPLTGLAAAAAAIAALDRGGRWLLDVPLVAVAAWVAAGNATAVFEPERSPSDRSGSKMWQTVLRP